MKRTGKKSKFILTLICTKHKNNSVNFTDLFFYSCHITKVNLKGYAGYVFDDKIDSYYDPGNWNEVKIKGGFQLGLGLEYMASANYGIELTYFNQSTTAPLLICRQDSQVE